MTLVANWSLRTTPISVFDVCRITGEPQALIKQLYRSGELGPPPDVSREVLTIPLYHVAALFVLIEATKKGIVWETAFEILQIIAGATFVEFQLAEVKAGRCEQTRATPGLNNQLWARLQSSRAKEDLEERLPGGPIETKRFALLDNSGWRLADNVDDLPTGLEGLKVLDARSIAATMKARLPGTFLATHIA